jgi:hypothetical protein
MTSDVVVIFGAGATKACGGPMTNEILREVFAAQSTLEREGFLQLLAQFLRENFHVSLASSTGLKVSDFPGLPLLLSIVDMAVDRKHPMGTNWPVDRLAHVRAALEYAIFALLENKLGHLTANPYFDLLSMIYAETGQEPTVISLNYDIIVDNVFLRLSETHADTRFPFYGCDIRTEVYKASQAFFGQLFKIHGSLNWLYCPNCSRLELGISERRRGLATRKVLEELYRENPLDPSYGCRGTPCKGCQAPVEPVLITPTHMKDYRNPHISAVWYRAQEALREARRVFIVGYSLPEDDVDVIYMLKRGLAHIRAENVTVVELDQDRRTLDAHPVGQRYRSLFGEAVDWQTAGFEEWLRQHQLQGKSPVSGRIS